MCLRHPHIRWLFWFVLALICVRVLPAAEQTISPVPDPTALLRAVADARLRLTSGTMDIDIGYYRFDRPKTGTKHLQIRLVFEGTKRRLEQFSREGSNLMDGEEAAKAVEAKLREFDWDFEPLVRLGLLRWKDAHSIIAYDGSTLLCFSELNRSGGTVTILRPNRTPNVPAFDPRVLGLTHTPQFSSTVEMSLFIPRAGATRLVGRELVDGRTCWHIAIELTGSVETLDFWLDADHPTRVRQMRAGARDHIICRYDENATEDPLPTEIVATAYRNGAPWIETRTLRRNTRYGVSLDDNTWTLAGLALSPGTPVIDARIQRHIGYWNGTGLSEEFVPGAKPAGPQSSEPEPPNAKKLLAFIESEPTTPLARESAIWILLNTPDGPEVNRAAELLVGHHAVNPKLALLCQGLKNSHHAAAPNLLRAILAANSEPDVRAFAGYSLAMILKRHASQGSLERAASERAAIEAETLFERVSADHGAMQFEGTTLGALVASELCELRTLRVGKTAPEIEGEDIDGRKLRLGDYRGKVVVLTFWGTWCGPCMEMVPDERKLVESMRGKPFALLGVDADTDRAKVRAVMEKEKITWPSFFDHGAPGPIAKAWNVHSWPTIYVLDRQGIIRHRGLRGPAVAGAGICHAACDLTSNRVETTDCEPNRHAARQLPSWLSSLTEAAL